MLDIAINMLYNANSGLDQNAHNPKGGLGMVFTYTEPYPISEIAKLAPEMKEGAFNALVLDIQERGQLEPCVILNAEVLDGRHRQRACLKLGRPIRGIRFEDVDNPDNLSPVDYVRSKNAHRRDLDESQKALLVLDLNDFTAPSDRHFLVRQSKAYDRRVEVESLMDTRVSRLRILPTN